MGAELQFAPQGSGPAFLSSQEEKIDWLVETVESLGRNRPLG